MSNKLTFSKVLLGFIITLLLGAVVFALVVFSVVALKYYAKNLNQPPAPIIEEAKVFAEDEYNMVFLNNSLFYFCKLKDYNSEYLECKEPYYLVRRDEKDKEGNRIQKTYVTSPKTEEVYKPKSPFYILKSNISYITKIGADSEVLQYINKQDK